MGYNFTITLCASVVAISLGACNGLTLATTDGQAGPESQGSLGISLTVAPQVQVSNLQDIHLSTNPKAPTSSDICIYSKTGQYQLQALGSGADAGFTLRQTDTKITNNRWAYQVRYDDGSGLQPLRSGIPLNSLTGADRDSLSCGNTGLNGQLQVSSQQPSAYHQRPGHYTGTLTLLVAPE